MALSASDTMLSALKAALDGGRMYWFSGPVPATAEEALDMVSSHTRLVEMTESGLGSTGLTFDPPSGGSMVKSSAETWSGTIQFSGANDGESTLNATFWRFCAAGDNGQSVADGSRVQGTIGTAGASINMASTALTANGSNTQGVSYFAITESAAI